MLSCFGVFGPSSFVAEPPIFELSPPFLWVQQQLCRAVERCNLTIRTFMKRFTRLALGFSKKVENLTAATAIHVAVYNFCRIHGSLTCTPAMAAGVIDRLWSMGDLFDAVTKHTAKERAKAKRERWIQRLIDRLEGGK